MKLNIYFLVSVSLLLTFTTSLNIKNVYHMQATNLKVDASRGWGNILKKAKNLVKNPPNLKNAINNGLQKAAAGVSSAANAVKAKIEADKAKADKDLKNGANNVKGAINCLFGKCPKQNAAPAPQTNTKPSQPAPMKIPTTLPVGNSNTPVKVIPGTDPDKNHRKNIDDAADDFDEFGPKKPTPVKLNEAKTTASPKKAQSSDVINVKSRPASSTTQTVTTTTTTETTEVVEQPRVIRTVVYEEFNMFKKDIQQQIDPRYVISKMQDDYMNQDNTIRFVATDSTVFESVSLKLYFKGIASDRVFYSQNNDPTYTNSINECKNHKIINNRLYNKPMVNMEPINIEKDKPIFDDILIPRCLTQPDSGNLKTNYINIYTLPEGTRLDKKCLKGEELNKQNSCIPYMRSISTGLLHALKLFNMGTSFFRHGNVFPHNIYFNIKKDAQRVFLDNMLYDSNKYDDINQKPFRRDMNLMGDTLISLITGSPTNPLKQPMTSTFEIYHGIKRYLWDNFIDLPLKSSAINMQNNIREGNGKCVTRAEFEFKLLKSVFNFIYRLKCTGIDPYNQFMDIDQALNHDFITSGSLIGAAAPGEQWDSSPADY